MRPRPSAAAGREALGERFSATGRSIPTPETVGAGAGAPAPRRMGGFAAQILPGGRGHGEPAGLGRGAERHCREDSLPPGRLGRPRRLEQHLPRRGWRDFQPGSYEGRNVFFGVREHAMGAVCNGMALHGGVIPYGATFLIFSDYMRPAIRLAALSRAGSIFVFTHDSVGLGEDGPTHQPIEHLASLRAMPRMVFCGRRTLRRPCRLEGGFGAARWAGLAPHPAEAAHSGSGCLRLGGGAAPGRLRARRSQPGRSAGGDSHRQGVRDPRGPRGAGQLEGEGIGARVVSLPSWELFSQQDALPRGGVAAGNGGAGCRGSGVIFWLGALGGGRAESVVGIDRFGASAPGAVALANLGITSENVVEAVRRARSARTGERTS